MWRPPAGGSTKWTGLIKPAHFICETSVLWETRYAESFNSGLRRHDQPKAGRHLSLSSVRCGGDETGIGRKTQMARIEIFLTITGEKYAE